MILRDRQPVCWKKVGGTCRCKTPSRQVLPLEISLCMWIRVCVQHIHVEIYSSGKIVRPTWQNTSLAIVNPEHTCGVMYSVHDFSSCLINWNIVDWTYFCSRQLQHNCWQLIMVFVGRGRNFHSIASFNVVSFLCWYLIYMSLSSLPYLA